jgi:hypothetical protein
MAIYLDANVLFPWRSFTELDRVALTIVASQIKQRIVVPEIAAAEGEANYRRSLERGVGRLEAAHRDLNRLFDRDEPLHLEGVWVDGHVDTWRERLEILGDVLPAAGDDAIEALRREARRVPPARPQLDGKGADKGGRGARDCAIWLAVVRDHLSRTEEGHFITSDVTDFLSEGDLKPELVQDIGDGALPLRVYAGIEEFLRLLGLATEDVAVSLNELAQRVPRVLEVVLPATGHIPRAVYGPRDDLRFNSEVKEATPTRVIAARHYAGSQDELTVVDSEWSIVADCYIQRRDTEDTDSWIFLDDVNLHGTIQLYLPHSLDEAVLPQIISARLESDVSVFEKGDQIFTIRMAGRTTASE